ncbi:MAG: cardiolipin synthase [Microbacteriaceae bacterium]|nr:cardiolipin synthase [Microbacteriaceae bacterium]
MIPIGSLTGWLLIVAIAVNAVIITVTAFTIGHNRRPTTAVAWLLTIGLIPYVGLLLFFLFGTNRLPRKRRAKQAEFNDILLESTALLEDAGAVSPVPDRYAPVATLARELTAIPVLAHNRLTIRTDYDPTITAMADEIDGAEQYVHLLFYAFAADEVTEPVLAAIERAVARGVAVRVLYDQIGSIRYRGYARMKRRLRESGCEWHRLYSIWPWSGNGWQRVDLRNHRKLLVVDGRVGWMGSQNLIERGYHRRPRRDGSRLLWKDLMVRVEGPMALGIDAVFRSDWYAETGELPADGDDPELLDFARWRALEGPGTRSYDCQLVPSGPGYEHENNLRLFVQLLYQAREQVVIASPYFAPDDSMLYAMTTAAQRGVDIELHVSEQGDQFFTQHAQQSYYEALLRAGVRIWLYRRPYVLHSKHMTVDNEVTLVGSSNMDMRSFTLNAEMMMIVYGPDFAERMREVELRYRAKSRELTLEQWLARPRWQAALDDLARLTSVVQ